MDTPKQPNIIQSTYESGGADQSVNTGKEEHTDPCRDIDPSEEAHITSVELRILSQEYTLIVGAKCAKTYFKNTW